jgi:NAD(P)H-dependent FMN reductase
MKKIVAISGTSRPDNYTSRALAVVTRALEASGCDVTPKLILEEQTRASGSAWTTTV